MPAPNKEGITLEDDVESMLSHTSNESMFRVRGVGNLGAGGAGDSTYRCNDSMYDEDRGLISESEDGFPQHDLNMDNKIDDISEHSSDEYVTDSEAEDPKDGHEPKPKKKKPKGEKGEKGEKKKKKKKKIEEEQ